MEMHQNAYEFSPKFHQSLPTFWWNFTKLYQTSGEISQNSVGFLVDFGEIMVDFGGILLIFWGKLVGNWAPKHCVFMQKWEDFKHPLEFYQNFDEIWWNFTRIVVEFHEISSKLWWNPSGCLKYSHFCMGNTMFGSPVAHEFSQNFTKIYQNWWNFTKIY